MLERVDPGTLQPLSFLHEVVDVERRSGSHGFGASGHEMRQRRHALWNGRQLAPVPSVTKQWVRVDVGFVSMTDVVEKGIGLLDGVAFGRGEDGVRRRPTKPRKDLHDVA